MKGKYSFRACLLFIFIRNIDVYVNIYTYKHFDENRFENIIFC